MSSMRLIFDEFTDLSFFIIFLVYKWLNSLKVNDKSIGRQKMNRIKLLMIDGGDMKWIKRIQTYLWVQIPINKMIFL